MNRHVKILFVLLLALILLIPGLLLTVTHWLPHLVGIWLPEGTVIVLEGQPRWQQGGFLFPTIHYRVQNCELATVTAARISYRQQHWLAVAQQVVLNSACLSQLSSAPASSEAPRTLAEWQKMLPRADVRIARLAVAPWQPWAGALHLKMHPRQQWLHYQGENLQLEAKLAGQQLIVRKMRLQAPGLSQPVLLHGQLELDKFANGIPQSGEVEGQIAVDTLPTPLKLSLRWKKRQGQLRLQGDEKTPPLLLLPWQATSQRISVTQGQWHWSSPSLAGRINFTLDNWQQGLAATTIRGRVNMLTNGLGGKGNIVLNLGPGQLSSSDSRLPFQLTGVSKISTLQFYTLLPGILTGPLTTPQLLLKPGALLRMRGRLLSVLDVEEARWPLASVKVSLAGINGRLQAILKTRNAPPGHFTVHLDGRADDFWPDKGRWAWRYWGGGILAPFTARWNVHGTGHWQDTTITLEKLATGFDKLRYGMTLIDKPRLTIKRPLIWQRRPNKPAFSGALALTSRRITFDYGGWLPPAEFNADLNGKDPSDFLFRGTLHAGLIGPLRINGRWDGERLRGQAWWPQQSLLAFQPLLSPTLKMRIDAGILRAQVAFSASRHQGLEAGGHWVVRHGRLWLPDSTVDNVDFSLPFRLKAHRWFLGTHAPVTLRIGAINNQFVLTNIRADLRGAWPWSEEQPLTLSRVSVDVLDGSLAMAQLRLPQHRAALIQLRDLNLSKLITALKPKQFAMSGRISGELPLWIQHPRWLIEQGRVTNNGSLTFRLDKDLADAIASKNVAAGAAMDWLRYMEITRAWTTLNLNTIGNLSMNTQFQGIGRYNERRRHVTLNYRHDENLFQLWRSLRFGDDLQSWVEQHAALPAH